MTRDDLKAYADEIKARHGLSDLDLYPSHGGIELGLIQVPKEKRRQGIGTAAMKDVTQLADRHEKTLWLSLAQKGERGATSANRLRGFYAKHGFVSNRGRHKDYGLSMYAQMYRHPVVRPKKTGLFDEGVLDWGKRHYPFLEPSAWISPGGEVHELGFMNKGPRVTGTKGRQRTHAGWIKEHPHLTGVDHKKFGTGPGGKVRAVDYYTIGHQMLRNGWIRKAGKDSFEVHEDHIEAHRDKILKHVHARHPDVNSVLIDVSRSLPAIKAWWSPDAVQHGGSGYGQTFRHEEHKIRECVASTLINLLFEDRMSFLKEKWGKTGVNSSHDTLALERTPWKIVGHFATHADPSSNKQYTDRIMHWYNKGQFRQEDHSRVHDALTKFGALKSKLTPEQRSLDKYTGLSHLEDTLDKVEPPPAKVPWASSGKDNRTVAEGSTIIHDGDNATVREVHTHDAMKVLGSNTKWCVVPSKEYFDMYQKQGPLYHIHDKRDNDRHLLHFESGQLMGVRDNEVEHAELAEKLPELRKIKEFHGQSYDFSDKNVFDQEFLKGGVRHLDSAIRMPFFKGTENPEVHRKILDNMRTAELHHQQGTLGQLDPAAKTSNSFADNPHITDRHRQEIASNTHRFDMAHTVIYHIKDPHVLHELSNNPNVTSDSARVVALVRNTHSPADTVNKFATPNILDYQTTRARPMQSALAMNVKTKPEHLHKLAHENMHPEVRLEVAANPSATPETLTHLLHTRAARHITQRQDYNFLSNLAGNHSAPSEMLHDFIKQPRINDYLSIRRTAKKAAENPGLSPEHAVSAAEHHMDQADQAQGRYQSVLDKYNAIQPQDPANNRLGSLGILKDDVDNHNDVLDRLLDNPSAPDHVKSKIRDHFKKHNYKEKVNHIISMMDL